MEQLEQMLTQIARHGTRRIGPDDEFVMAPHYFHQVGDRRMQVCARAQGCASDKPARLPE